jgi:hypothetical protein
MYLGKVVAVGFNSDRTAKQEIHSAHPTKSKVNCLMGENFSLKFSSL